MNDKELLAEFVEEVEKSSSNLIDVDLDDIKPEMDRTFVEGKPRGEATHFAPLDALNMFSWKRGFLYCISGNPASGKSEFMNMLTLLKSLHDGWKWLVYSPESYPLMDYVDTLIHMLVGKSTDPSFPNQMSKAHYDKGFEFVKKHFEVIDFKEMPTVKELMQKFEESDCDGILIDPFNSLDDEGANIYDFLKKSLTKIKQTARELQKVCVIIEHPRSDGSLDENGNPKEPSEYTLNGGKMWHNKCDVIGIVHRPLVHSDPTDDTVTFRTRKVKNQKLNGMPNLLEGLHFDRSGNRYWKFDSQSNRVTGFEKDKPISIDESIDKFEQESGKAPF